MEGGEPDLECFSARLWEQQAQLDLDLETMSYGKLEARAQKHTSNENLYPITSRRYGL